MVTSVKYGGEPRFIKQFDLDVSEFMMYVYLPVKMDWLPIDDIRLPANVENLRDLIETAIKTSNRQYKYVYLSVRKGWASHDNPLNRPGWHTDGFGTDDLNYIWWEGPGTRFAIQEFIDISLDHNVSMKQFQEQISNDNIRVYPEKGLYELDPKVVHATPEIPKSGCMRQFVKISLSDNIYNLKDNSHNYLFDYDWKLTERNLDRNDPHTQKHKR